MRRVWEHVDRLNAVGDIARVEDDGHLARKRLGIARHIHHALRSDPGEHPSNDLRRASLSRRIEDDGVKTFALQTRQRILHAFGL